MSKLHEGIASDLQSLAEKLDGMTLNATAREARTIAKRVQEGRHDLAHAISQIDNYRIMTGRKQ